MYKKFINLKNSYKFFVSWLDINVFPGQIIYNHQIPIVQQITIFLFIFVLFSIIGALIQRLGFVGYDWVYFFDANNTPVWYPPWVKILIQFFTWPTLIGVTFASIMLAIIKRSICMSSAVIALFTLPVFWTIFLGQLDGLVVLGLLGLPWLAPLALIKPQVALFAFGARLSYLFSFILIFIISIFIWRSWPAELLSIFTFDSGSFIKDNDIAFGLWGLPIALILIFFSRGDMDMLMAGGVYMTPYLLPYNLLPLVPSIARLPSKQAFLAGLLTWTPLLANWIGPIGWWLIWLFVILLWFGLAEQRYGLIQKIKIQLGKSPTVN